MSAPQKYTPLTFTNKVISILNKTDGRDKFSKAIQGLSRYLTWYYLNKDRELSDRMNGLSNGMRDARKLFRLFKTMNELEKLIELSQKPSADTINNILNVLIRSFFGGYWFFDNLVILITVKFLKSNKENASKAASTFWFTALVLSQIQILRNIYMNFQKIVKLKVELANGSNSIKVEEQIQALKKKNINEFMNIVKCAGDMVAAGQGASVWEKLLGKVPNGGLIGLGGLVSASIAGYQMF